MPPNLRSVVSQGWRSIGSRRNFSSSPGSKSGDGFTMYEAIKSSVYPSFTTFRLGTWSLYGYALYGEAYQLLTMIPELERLGDLIHKQRMMMISSKPVNRTSKPEEKSV
ncbi:unnamed protein product [Microthlaspi erraticum]|uniref:Uncharacterized protein n=1 Tax=Microthlaspi erraticum TaxID=1685480 RepID=A0A6D2JHN0_9BRAS|nr:unnamed protein product [Microthlaspi erraticum]